MDDLDYRAAESVKKIEDYERSWHLFKALLLTIGILMVIIIQIYTYRQLLNNSNNNHQLICSISRQAQLSNQEITQDCK